MYLTLTEESINPTTGHLVHHAVFWTDKKKISLAARNFSPSAFSRSQFSYKTKECRNRHQLAPFDTIEITRDLNNVLDF